jgi:RNA polymerase sigma-70 factor (ECF subfamily)
VSSDTQKTSWRILLDTRDPSTAVARAAMDDFARVYWLPVYGHVRRRVSDPERSLDLTQEFFATWLEKRWVEGADPARGRFRTFLFVVLDRFLADQHDRERALKRGGGQSRIPLDAGEAERMLAGRTEDGVDPARLFNQRWAMAVVRDCLDQLRREYAGQGKGVHADLFIRYYGFESTGTALGYALLAQEFGLSETDVTNYLQRARASFRKLLEHRVLQSVESPDEVRGEIDELFRSLAR